MDQTLPTNSSVPQPETPQVPATEPAAQPSVTDATTQPPVAPAPSSPEPTPALPAEQPVTPTPATSTQDPSPEPTPSPVPAPPTTAPAAAPTPTPPGSPVPAGTTPSAPQPGKKKGINMWVVLLLIILIALLGGGAYFLAKTQLSGQPVAQMPTPIPVVKKNVTPLPSTPIASPTATITGTEAVGSVSGTLCYPSSGVPAGTIYAKNLTTGKEMTQAYKGTAAGESTAYTMSLPVGMYHMKFVPTQNSTTIGYYTEYSTCVNSPSEPNCTGTKTRAILPVTVTADQVTPKINLCDYYYPAATPPQY